MGISNSRYQSSANPIYNRDAGVFRVVYLTPADLATSCVVKILNAQVTDIYEHDCPKAT